MANLVEDLTNSPVGEIEENLMSTSLSAARPSRRAIVRGAAWSVPVIAVAAAAPAFATSGEGKASGLANTAVKWGSGSGPGALNHVSWDIQLSNGGKVIDSTTVKFTYIPTSGAGRGFDAATILGFDPTNTANWDKTGITNPVAGQYVISASNTDDHAAFSSYSVHVDFYGTANNSAGTVEAVVTFTYKDTTTSTVTIPQVSWKPGSQHAGH